MKTQISRQSFTAEKRYSGVYQQMGRMITDADWNELTDLLQFEVADALEDVVGKGTPRRRGLVREADPGVHRLYWGHVYVDGLRGRVASRGDDASPYFRFDRQADFPAAPTLTEGRHWLYVDLWERTVTHLEDPALLDSALKGADTATRRQRMAQVKACPSDRPVADIEHNARFNPRIGTIPIDVAVNLGETLPDPCDPCADELALRDEVGNYLFRLEVHDTDWATAAGGDPELTGLVLKWSSENGAEHYPVGVTPPGFESGQWAYEFYSGPDADPDLDMRTEKHLGHHLFPGFSPARGELRSGYPTTEPAGFALVRRWDGFVRLRKNAGAWELVEGVDRGRSLSTGYGSGDHGQVDLSGPVGVNLDALTLTLDLDQAIAVPGDHWLAPVRQAEHAPGDALLSGALPTGVEHHYFVLGEAEVNAEGVITGFTPEREDRCTPFGFPPLTDIEARDVCYDNETCDMPEVRSVQDAIDYLCKARDLRWHHKHLHGMGVVCGLVVECGPDTLPDPDGGAASRRLVTVTRGAALDCDGNILELDQARHLDVIEHLEPLLEAHPDLIENGRGTLCLWIEPGANGEPRLRLEPHRDQENNHLLDGTLWMDFYQHCVKNLVDQLKSILEELSESELAEDEAESDVPVSSRRKEATSLLNLFAQLLYRPHGQWVFLSRREHDRLRIFYLRLRELVQSQFFCGMAAGEDFPDYPFPDTEITTAFGKHHHEEVLMHPAGSHTLTYAGTDTTVNVYDNDAAKVVAISEVSAGEGAQVTAMAFDPSGDLLYAASAVNANDSLLSRGRFAGGDIEWERSVVLCDVHAEDLTFDPRTPNRLYLTGYGKGLYRLNLVELFGEEKVIPEPRWSFNALGPVAYDFDRDRVYATAAAREVTEPERYDRIALIDLNDSGDGNEVPTMPLVDAEGNELHGEDDIVLQPAGDNQGGLLQVVVNESNTRKAVLGYALPLSVEGMPPRVRLGPFADTRIRLLHHPQLNRLLVSVEDEFRLLSAAPGQVEVQRIPVQLMPTAMTLQPETGRVIALNYMSNTLTLYPRRALDVSEAFLNELAEYRMRILTAYIALAGNLLQYLKDCFCHQLLIKCPDCGEDDKVYLARIDIRDNQVYKVCNFGKRKDVWTFPKVEYWLSLVPVIPMIRKGVAEFCCLVLPNLFGRYAAQYQPDQPTGYAVRGRTYRKGVTRSKTANPRQSWRERKSDVQVNARLAGDAVLYREPKVRRATVSKQAYRNLDVNEAVAELERNDVKVAEVVKYDASRSGNALRRTTLTPDRIEKGSEVVVYEEDNKAIFYALKQPDAPGFNTALAQEELQQLRVEKDQLVSEIRQAESELNRMKVARNQHETALGSLKQQFDSLEQQRTQVMADVHTLQTGVQSLEQELKAMKIEMAKSRPVKDIAEVTDEDEAALNRAGIRNLGELAVTDVNLLAERSGLSKTKLETLVGNAKKAVKIQPE